MIFTYIINYIRLWLGYLLHWIIGKFIFSLTIESDGKKFFFFYFFLNLFFIFFFFFLFF
jgi:hypothetical protein